MPSRLIPALLACLAAVAALTAVLPAAAQPADLLFYAPFDKTASAAVARGNAANLSDSVFGFAPGRNGEALELGGPCRFATPGNFSPREGTLALWVQPHWDGNDPGTHYLFCLYGEPGVPESYAMSRFSLYCGGRKITFAVFDSAKTTRGIEAPITAWQKGEWHHIAATWAGIGDAKAVLTLYLDGKKVARDDQYQILVGKQNSFFDLGNDQDNTPKPGDALADDVFIYSRALTAAEVSRGAGVSPAEGEIAGETPAPRAATAPRVVKSWWDTQYPFRAEVVLPASDTPRKDVFIQTRLHLGDDLSALGLNASLDDTSLRVCEVNPATGAETGPLPLRIEDGIAEWLAAGPVPTGATRRFRLYFRSAEYTFPQPLVAVRTAVTGQMPPAPGKVPDYATEAYGKPWDFADNLAGIDQWGNKPEFVQNRKVENGILSMDVKEDPWFIWGDMWGQVDSAKRKVAIDVARYPILEMKVRQSVPSAEWNLYGRVGKRDDLLFYKWQVNGTGWQRLRVDLRNQAHWKGVLSAFRIDPTRAVAAHVDMAWVRLIAATSLEHGHVETIGRPNAVPRGIALEVPYQGSLPTGAVNVVRGSVTDDARKPVAGQPITVALASGSGGELQQAGQRSLALGPQTRTGLTDESGRFEVKYLASHKPGAPEDTLVITAPFTDLKPTSLPVQVVTGAPHHLVVTPAKATAVDMAKLPLVVTAQVADEYDNPVAKPGVAVAWDVTDAKLTETTLKTDATGKATAKLWPDVAKRWVYTVKVSGGLQGQSGPICLISSAPRPNPGKLGSNAMYQTADGKPWLALGGFYANWVGVPANGEEGRRLYSFTDATEEQMVHWLDFLHRQGVTTLRFMLRTHRPNGMEPMDIGGRVNMDLFARALRYMDLARPFGIRFLLTIHEDYDKPVYCNEDALQRWALPKFAGEDLDKLPAFQRRFIRDGRLLDTAAEKYADPDAIACQDQYARQLIAMLKGNPQVFAYELENEMVNCPASWANHAMATIRAVDPSTLICVSHGGGGLETADPLWWKRNTTIDFYTYHLYAYPGSVTPSIDFGCAADILTRYGRMAAPCQLGETAGDEFEYHQDPEVRRYVMRDLIWSGLTNGNPGVFFWNARGFEVEQYRLAAQTLAQFDFTTWKRAKPEIGIKVEHPITDDRFYGGLKGHEQHALMGKYAQYYMSQGVDFDFTMDGQGYPKAADVMVFTPPEPSRRYFTLTPGWQLSYNAREGFGEGFAYVRNLNDIQLWEVPGKAKMWLRTRKPVPLKVTLDLPLAGCKVTATDLDTGEVKDAQLAGKGELDLGTSGHDWVVVWKGK